MRDRLYAVDLDQAHGTDAARVDSNCDGSMNYSRMGLREAQTPAQSNGDATSPLP